MRNLKNIYVKIGLLIALVFLFMSCDMPLQQKLRLRVIGAGSHISVTAWEI